MSIDKNTQSIPQNKNPYETPERKIDQRDERRGCPVLATVFAQECIKSCTFTTLLLVTILTLMYAFGLRPIPL